MNITENFMFVNREEAGHILSSSLEEYKGMNGVVVAIPPGGVPIGYIIAKDLHFKLDLAFSKKIEHPLYGEYAIGAVSLTDCFIEDHAEVPKEYIQKEELRIRNKLKEMYNAYVDENKTPEVLKDKIVIITDDGMATGRTILNVIRMVKKHYPLKIIIAVPVSSQSALVKIKRHVDEIICPLVPELFVGVSRFYKDFKQLDDDEVKQYLEKHKNQE